MNRIKMRFLFFEKKKKKVEAWSIILIQLKDESQKRK